MPTAGRSSVGSPERFNPTTPATWLPVLAARRIGVMYSCGVRGSSSRIVVSSIEIWLPAPFLSLISTPFAGALMSSTTSDVRRLGQVLAGGDQVAAGLEVGDQQVLVGLGQRRGHRRRPAREGVVAGEPDHDLVLLELADVGQRLRLAGQLVDVQVGEGDAQRAQRAAVVARVVAQVQAAAAV